MSQIFFATLDKPKFIPKQILDKKVACDQKLCLIFKNCSKVS